MDGRLLHPRAENRDVKYWSESNQYASGDSLPAGYVSRYIETTQVSVRQNDLEELKQIWEDLSRADRQAFVDRYGDIAYLLYVQVNEPMLRALIKFWNPGYRCFTLNNIDLMPTVEEYSELLRVPNIIEDRIYTKPKRNTNMSAQLAAFTGRSEEWASGLISKKGESSCFSWFDIANITRTYLDPLKKADLIAIAIYGLVIFPRVLGYIDVTLFDVFDQFRYDINPAPAILAETFISLNAYRELEGGRFRGCAQLLYVWIRSHFWKTPKPVLHGIRSINFSPLQEFLATEWEEVDPTKWVEAFWNLQEHDLVWRNPWLLTIEYLYRCYNYHWLMLLGLWGAIGCAHLLVSRQFGSRQFMSFTAGLRESCRAQHVQLEARVREQEDIIREYQTRDEYTELQASQSKVEALEKEVKDLWALVQTCQISVQVLEDAKEGGDDYWFTRLRHAAHRFQEQDKTNEKIMNLAQDVAEHVTTIAQKARILRPHAISREMKSELELLFDQIEDLGG
ncbi:hypothetical protein GQ457_12G014280 [Hibiscus cannabinus]